MNQDLNRLEEMQRIIFKLPTIPEVEAVKSTASLFSGDDPRMLTQVCDKRIEILKRATDTQSVSRLLKIEFEKFTENARKILQGAQKEAQRVSQTYIGPEHILLSIARSPDCVAAEVLIRSGLDLKQIISAVEFVIGRGILTSDPLGLTPRAKRVIELAVDEARRSDHHYIGSEHLLIGLIREDESIAAGVLATFGLQLQKVRDEVLKMLKTPKELE